MLKFGILSPVRSKDNNIIICADGAHSKIRKWLLNDDQYLDNIDINYILEMKFKI